jgi:MFS family permease
MLRAAEQIPVSRRSAPPTWVVVALVCAGPFLVVLDVSVVNVALPSMRADLALSAPGLQWVVNAYAIAFAGFMLLGGRAGDLYGRNRMFLVGLALFTLASLGGGLAQAEWQLLAARAVQGLGAAVLVPSTLTILTSAVPEGAARARAIATWTAVGGVGGAAGGLVGGALVDGAGLAATPLAALATSGAEPGDAGLVSGLVNTSRTMGGSLGLSVMSTIAAARTGGGSSPEALTEGYALVFRTGTGVLLGGAVLMLVWLPRRVRARA